MVWKYPRMEDCKLPKKILYGELKERTQSRSDQKKCLKDNLKHNLKKCGIDVDGWETLAADRPLWRSVVASGVAQYEEQRRAARDTRRRRMKDQTSQPTVDHTFQFVCSTCGGDCQRIGLFSYDKAKSDNSLANSVIFETTDNASMWACVYEWIQFALTYVPR